VLLQFSCARSVTDISMKQMPLDERYGTDAACVHKTEEELLDHVGEVKHAQEVDRNPTVHCPAPSRQCRGLGSTGVGANRR